MPECFYMIPVSIFEVFGCPYVNPRSVARVGGGGGCGAGDVGVLAAGGSAR